MITQWIAERNAQIFGFKITPVTEAEIVEAVGVSRDHNEQLVIASQNLHGLYVGCVDSTFRELHELDQTLVHTDGSAPVYLAKAHGLPVGFEHRTGVHDWLPILTAEASRRGWSIYCLASDDEINNLAIERLRGEGESEGPGARIGGRNGFFDVTKGSRESEEVLAQIAAFDPDILLVGMGMGRQEQWIHDNLEQLGPRTIITVGACLEYMAGAMPLPPKWFGPTGLFMLLRVVTRPRRYAFRYLVEPWLLFWELGRSGRLSGSAREVLSRGKH